MAANILSIHYGHNATVGFSCAGKVLCLISEERINRMKNATGFPSAALEYVVQHYLNGDKSKIDAVVLSDHFLHGFDYLKRHGYESHKFIDYYCYTRKNDINYLFRPNWKRLVKTCVNLVRNRLFPKNINPKKALAELAKHIGVTSEKIMLLNHHQSHAYSCLHFLDPQKKYLIMTLDGEGDGICSSVNIWDNGNLEVLQTTSRNQSLGYVYSEVTAYLGMKSNEHEFKVMGMAPYADPKQAQRVAQIFRDLLWLNDKGQFASKISMPQISEYLISNLIYERFDNICGGLQIFTEELMCQWVDFWIKKTGVSDIATSGGVFMNVKAAKRVAEIASVNSIFVMPSSGDESLPIGGCVWGALKLGIEKIYPIEDLYLGREFSDGDIEKYIRDNKIDQRYQIEKLEPQVMAMRVAKLLAQNEIVARCCGREEWGARALGNRSILCNPSNFRNINVLNQKIKSRDFWMPFTPSILAEDLDLYINNPKKIFAPYMCITFDTTSKAQNEIPAAIHPNDGTARPQAVFKDWNSDYHTIISEFKKLTGISGILNTSFNLHGEPNVGGPADAIHTVDHSGLNYLILGSYLLIKKAI